MKQLTCEMCGSVDLVKQDGLYICQSCKTKYTVEEAKKMMIEGPVEVHGTVRIDNTGELEKLYQAARNAREASDATTAIMHYENISSKDPNSWEALFYLTVLKTENIKNGEIGSSALKVANSLDRVIQLISENVDDDEKKQSALEEVYKKSEEVGVMLFLSSEAFCKSLKKGNGMMALTGIGGLITSATSSSNANHEHQIRCSYVANISSTFGDSVEKYFDMDNGMYRKFAIDGWKGYLSTNDLYKAEHKTNLFVDDFLKKYVDKIKKYIPNYEYTGYGNMFTASSKPGEPSKSSGGCYVATCVYGSYDCPEVWTLRRFRDYTLSATWYGRAFIKVYYAISPKLVKAFGNCKWFKNMWRGKLDKMVMNLRKKGFEDTPYND